MRKSILTATLLATAAMAVSGLPRQAHAGTYNGSPDLGNHWDLWTTDPTGQCGPDGMEVDFSGNVVSQLNTPVTTDYWINPEYALQLAGGPPAVTVSVTYDPSANLTRYVSLGGELPQTAPAGFLGPVQNLGGTSNYHDGINLGWNTYTTPLVPVGRQWLFNCNGTQSANPREWLYISATKPVTNKSNPNEVAYAGIFIETMDGAAGEWDLIAYQKTKTGAVSFNLKNASPMPVTPGLAGIVMNLPVQLSQDCQEDAHCAANEALLDQLNGLNAPLPGQEGSFYTVLKLPAKPIKPGATIHFKSQ
jgi:hypothetical protein